MGQMYAHRVFLWERKEVTAERSPVTLELYVKQVKKVSQKNSGAGTPGGEAAKSLRGVPPSGFNQRTVTLVHVNKYAIEFANENRSHLVSTDGKSPNNQQKGTHQAD